MAEERRSKMKQRGKGKKAAIKEKRKVVRKDNLLMRSIQKKRHKVEKRKERYAS